MKNLDTPSTAASFLCLEINSIALGYRALAILTQVESVRVLDASPSGAGFLILALGEASELEKVVQEMRSRVDGSESDIWRDRELTPEANMSVIEAFFGLPQTELDEALVIVECATVSACSLSAHTLVTGHALKPIEIRVLRTSTGGAYGFFTGPADVCAAAAEDVRAKLRANLREGRVEVIDNPSAGFRSFFNLSGNDSGA